MCLDLIWIEVHTVVAELAAMGAAILCLFAEMLHAIRVRRVAELAFGPTRRPALWAIAAPIFRVCAVAALTWGMVTLILIQPKVHQAEVVQDGEYKHIVMVLDVSPSMRLQDAGTTKDISRMRRAREVMESFFQRVAIEQFRVSVIATYTDAKNVVVDTKDLEVVRNILGDLPMHYAFSSGKTDIFAGLREAFEIARPWNPKSTTLILVSDGDTVPATGMPKPPASIGSFLVVGVGDPVKGKFIDGKNSRQEVSTLRQVAMRLGGFYHNGNEKHLSTDLLKQLTSAKKESPFEKLTRREYALMACALGAAVLALLPILLHYFGTSWRPGANRSSPTVNWKHAA